MSDQWYILCYASILQLPCENVVLCNTVLNEIRDPLYRKNLLTTSEIPHGNGPHFLLSLIHASHLEELEASLVIFWI